MKRIEKKLLPEYFEAVRRRVKTFELRKDDSGYQEGDILTLREWDGERYTGRKITREITYILRDAPQYGLAEGFCVLAIQPIGWNSAEYVQSETTVIQNGENNRHIVNTGTMTIHL